MSQYFNLVTGLITHIALTLLPSVISGECASGAWTWVTDKHPANRNVVPCRLYYDWGLCHYTLPFSFLYNRHSHWPLLGVQLIPWKCGNGEGRRELISHKLQSPGWRQPFQSCCWKYLLVSEHKKLVFQYGFCLKQTVRILRVTYVSHATDAGPALSTDTDLVCKPS